MTVVRAEMLDVVTQIADELAAPNADDVDRQARFRVETIEGLKAGGVLGALVPTELGGLGSTMSEAGDAITALSRRCSSSAMILAMHHLQVACLAAHGHNKALRNFLSDVADRQLLLASATTEVGGEAPVEAVVLGGHGQANVVVVRKVLGRRHEAGCLEQRVGTSETGGELVPRLSLALGDLARLDDTRLHGRSPGDKGSDQRWRQPTDRRATNQTLFLEMRRNWRTLSA